MLLKDLVKISKIREEIDKKAVLFFLSGYAKNMCKRGD